MRLCQAKQFNIDIGCLRKLEWVIRKIQKLSLSLPKGGIKMAKIRKDLRGRVLHKEAPTSDMRIHTKIRLDGANASMQATL